MSGEVNPVQQENEFLWRRLAEPVHWLGKEIDGHVFWLAILIPVLSLALAYVVWMYRRDSRSVGWRWATFLGVLRCAVYVVLAVVFLLPAEQSYEQTQTQARVVVLFDVSGSMGTKDLLPTEAVAADKVLSRQDKIIEFLNDKQVGFLKRLRDRNPVLLYRFGDRLDPEARAVDEQDAATGLWATWLKPRVKDSFTMADLNAEERKHYDELDPKGRVGLLNDKRNLYVGLVNGTNLGEAVSAALNREANNRLQGIIVVSDGRDTTFSQQVFDDIQKRAERVDVPIFSVAVGEERVAVEILQPIVQAPDQARPDDKFPVRVDVEAKNLPDHDLTVKLDVYKPKADLKKEAPAYQMEVPARFSKDPKQPHAQVEFQIDPAQVPVELRKAEEGSSKPELVEGEYKIRARVPRHKEEVFEGKEHVSDAATVNVVKRPIRVLLFASAPTREYQFVRTLFVRETGHGRAELSICLQLAGDNIVQDVPQERLLKQFPTTFGDIDKAEDKYNNLALYDVVIGFDPDWTQLTPEQMGMLENWVNAHYGGLILIGGPVHTVQLVQSATKSKLKPILDLYPVELADSRYGPGSTRPTTDPQWLRFPGANSDMDFLNLNEDKDSPLSGWWEFFTGQKARPGEEGPPRRGFYNYYPVQQKKANAMVVATFADPRALLNNGQQQPYLVAMPYGSGKVVYLGSGEMWRLRQYHEAFHERFWTKLARYVGSGNLTRLARHGDIFMGPTYTANDAVTFDARLYGRDMQPLGQDSKPPFRLKIPQGAPVPALEPMKAKPSDPWNGFFTARFTPTAEGTYEVELDIPGTGETLRHKFYVKPSNPELDNTMPDFGRLRLLASDAGKVLNRIKDEERLKVRPVLERTNNLAAPEGPGSGEARKKLKLYFDLEGARAIPDCMISDARPLKTRGPVKDLWDEGFTVGDYADRPLTVSWVLLAIVVLLSIEWLSRKLLKLA